MEYLPLIIGYLIVILNPVIGLWQKALPRLERKATDAYIPFYGYVSALKAMELPRYWVIFLLMPGVQMIMMACINVSYLRKFGVFDWKETVLGVLFPYPVFWKIAKNPEQYKVAEPTNWDIAAQVDRRTPSDHVALFFALPIIGHAIVYPLSLLGFKRKPGKKSMIKEWGDAVLFAVIAASAIRTYVFEPYKIPTGSMEKTLLVGDHLFVDKLTYGPRLPMTPFSYPVVHNSFAPLINIKSYLEVQKIPYTRLPGFSDVDRYDVVVFNFPAGDTALNDPRMPDGLIGHNYHEILRDEALLICLQEGNGLKVFESNKAKYLDKARKRFDNEGKVYARKVRDEDVQRGYTEVGGLLDRPVDKRENYIKRCVAVSGDVIEIKDKELFINGELAYQPEFMQYNYTLGGYAHPYLYGMEWTAQQDSYFRKNFEVGVHELGVDDSGYVTVPLRKGLYEKRALSFPNLIPHTKKRGYYKNRLNKDVQEGRIPRYYPIFPNDPKYDWTEDNFGPLKIPSKGDVVEINEQTIPIYRRIISAYEGHTLEEKSDGIYIDGKKVSQYTIQQNYFWMMGDNRNNSADSRFWGFVPEDHVVGHAAFVWLSVGEKGMFGGGMRWNRMFSGIK